MGIGNADFDQYRLSDEQVMLRAAVRELADDKIAPRAAAIDEDGEFPYDVLDALVRAGFHAVHIPEAYGGPGADAISACIVVEEVARACASSSLIPAVNKLGTMAMDIRTCKLLCWDFQSLFLLRTARLCLELGSRFFILSAMCEDVTGRLL